MWSHSPHHTYARCGEILDLSTSHMAIFENTPNVEKYQISPHLSCGKLEITLNVEKFQISPHLSCIKIWNFSTWQIFLHMSYLWYLWQISGMIQCTFQNAANKIQTKSKRNFCLDIKKFGFSTMYWSTLCFGFRFCSRRYGGNYSGCSKIPKTASTLAMKKI